MARRLLRSQVAASRGCWEFAEAWEISRAQQLGGYLSLLRGRAGVPVDRRLFAAGLPALHLVVGADKLVTYLVC